MEEEEEEEGSGARRKRAWPVRSRREMTFLNLETVRSVRSVQSTAPGWWRFWRERTPIRCSMVFSP